MKQYRSSILAVLALAAGFALTHLPSADAQVRSYSRTGTSAVGEIWGVYNAIDSLILDGTVLIVDTTTTQKRVVVRPFAGTALTRGKCIGLAVGNIGRRGEGRMLVRGYHPRAKMAASDVAANTMIKVAMLHGALAASVDTVYLQVGWAIGMNSGFTSSRYTARVFITNPLGRPVQSP